MERDVILTAFACSAQAPCEAWANDFFSDPPLVLNVPGGDGAAFRSHASTWGASGDAFKAALQEAAAHRPELKGVTIRRRGLVTFSVGWSFADNLFGFAAERQRLDAYVLLDGCHTRAIKPWVEFATRAANMEALMMMAHTAIDPHTFPSTTTTNTEMFKQACENNDANLQAPNVTSTVPDYVLHGQLPDGGVMISLAGAPGLNPISKHWVTDPLVGVESRGNLYKLSYDGNDRPDHVFVAWFVAKRMWQWLGEEWSKVATGSA